MQLGNTSGSGIRLFRIKSLFYLSFMRLVHPDARFIPD
jgi:hypothetical protein